MVDPCPPGPRHHGVDLLGLATQEQEARVSPASCGFVSLPRGPGALGLSTLQRSGYTLLLEGRHRASAAHSASFCAPCFSIYGFPLECEHSVRWPPSGDRGGVEFHTFRAAVIAAMIATVDKESTRGRDYRAPLEPSNTICAVRVSERPKA